MALEPGHDIGINAKSQLLLDGSIEEAALDAGLTEEFGRGRNSHLQRLRQFYSRSLRATCTVGLLRLATSQASSFG